MDKEKIKAIENSGLPEDVKAVGKMGVLLDAKPEAIVKGMMGVINQSETKKAEAKNPEPQHPDDYSEIEKIIVGMLTESTGTNMLDSGGAYGRHWQTNRKIKDFRDLPELEVTVWKDKNIELNVNVFHYLTSFLEVDETVKRLETEFKKYLEDNPDLCHLAAMEGFAEKLGYKSSTFNTYNYDNLLSQVLQGVTLQIDTDYLHDYVILQIHNGCDVRGGYTAPRIFHIPDVEYFIMAQSDIDASCGCGSVCSDDCGYNFYEGIGEFKDREEYKLPKEWVVKPKHRDAKNWEYKLMCEKCNKEVTFIPHLDY